MNRRTALMLTLLSGGLLPARLAAQDDEDAPPRPSRRPAARRARPIGDEAEAEAEPLDDAPEPIEADGGLPEDFPTEPGHALRTFDISRYTSLPHKSTRPQDALVEWVFRRTGSAAWHGDRIAALSAGRAQLRAYHNTRVLQQVEEVVERFTAAEPSDVLQVRVRFVAAADPRWRYLVHTRLNPLGSGSQGQQIWTLRADEAAMVLAQMQVHQGFKNLGLQEFKVINGQPFTVSTTEDLTYVAGPQRDSAAGAGFAPGSGQLQEGVILRMSPLLTYEGDALDVALDLSANTVRKLHAVKILARREVGAVDMTIDVPEVSHSRLNRWYSTIRSWPLGQTMLISAGIQPGILQKKTGLFNLRIPGTVPTTTELLVFLDAETVADAPRTARRPLDD